MIRRFKGILAVVFAVGGVLANSAVQAQNTAVLLNGATAFDNVSAAGQAPGNMVSRGVGRALAKADDGFASVLAPQITETERQRSVGDQFRIDSVPIIANEATRIILVLINQWILRAGLGDLFPGLADIITLFESGSVDPTTPDPGSTDTTPGPTRPDR